MPFNPSKPDRPIRAGVFVIGGYDKHIDDTQTKSFREEYSLNSHAVDINRVTLTSISYHLQDLQYVRYGAMTGLPAASSQLISPSST